MTPDHDPVSPLTVLTVVLVLFVALLFTGCASTCITKTTAQGDKWEVRSNRFLWQTERVSIKPRASGLIEVEVNQTKPDAEAFGAVIGAAIKAAK